MAVPPAPKVYLRDTDGTIYSADPADVPKGLAAGLRHETPDEVKDRELRNWANDNPTLALAAAGARTLSFGATGLANSKEQAALKEAHPVLSSVGEFGSMLIPFAGEAGIASKAAKILSESAAVRNSAKVIDTVAKATGLPMAGAAKVGGAVGKVIGGGAAAGVGRRALGTAAGLATESELYNIGANLGEAALGDEDLTADRLLAHSGTALALGAGLGFGGSLLASGTSKLLDKSNAALAGARNVLEKDLPGVSAMENAATAAKEAYVDHATAASGHDRAYVDSLVSDIGTPEGMARRERLTTPLTNEEVDKLGKAVAEPLNAAVKATDEALRSKGWGEIAQAQIKKLIGPRPLEPVVRDSQEVFGALRKLESNMLEAPERYDHNLVGKFNSTFTGFEQAIKGVWAVASDGGQYPLRAAAKDAAEVFENMAEMRRHIDDLIPYAKHGEKLTSAQQRTTSVLKEARDAITAHLRKTEIYGGGATARAELDRLSKLFYDTVGPKSDFAKVFTKNGRGKEASSVKTATYLRQIDAFRGADRQEAITAFFDTMQEINSGLDKLAKQVDVHFDSSKLSSLHKTTTGARDAAASRLAESAKARQATNDTTSLLERKGVSVAAGATVGAVLGGPAGALAGAAAQYGYRMLNDPILAGKTILALEKINTKVSGRVAQTIKSFLGAAPQVGKMAVKKLAAPTSVFAMHHVLADRDLPKVRGDERDSVRMRDFRQLEALLTSLVTNPERAYDRYDQAFKVFRDAAPKLTDRLIQKQLEAAQFLFSKLPKNPSAGKTLNDAINDWRPSDQDLAKFERYVKAANDPLSVLDDMQHGAITREGVDTLRTLYPSLYSSIQEHVLDNLANLQRRVPYTQRLNLSLLLNAPVDPSVTPAFVATMQGFYQGSVQSQVQGQQGGIAKVRGTGGSAIKPSALKSFGKASTLTAPQRLQFKSAL